MDKVVPNTINVAGVHNISHSFKIPVLGEATLDLVLDKTNITKLDSANTTFGTFTETGVNTSIQFKNTLLVSLAKGKVCIAGDCKDETDNLEMKAPLTLKAHVSYKIKKLGPLPVGLDGTPCLGPVLESALGKATVVGFGKLDKYITEAVNKAISEQHLFEKPLDEAMNDVLKRLQKGNKNCNFTEPLLTPLLY